jgi:hypothetical protein
VPAEDAVVFREERFDRHEPDEPFQIDQLLDLVPPTVPAVRVDRLQQRANRRVERRIRLRLMRFRLEVLAIDPQVVAE